MMEILILYKKKIIKIFYYIMTIENKGKKIEYMSYYNDGNLSII
jgi:hypothetical protein